LNDDDDDDSIFIYLFIITHTHTHTTAEKFFLNEIKKEEEKNFFFV
jgi:hypothetical protein